MSKALEFQPIVQRREFYQIQGIETNNECIILSQLVYWGKVSKFKEFYKTDEELREETRISRYCMEQIKKKLKTLPFVIITRKGVPAKTYYKIDPQKLLDEIKIKTSYVEECLSIVSEQDNSGNKIPGNQETRCLETRKLDTWKPGNKIPGNQETIYRTENTSETTTENTTKKKENTAIAQIEYEHERELSEAEFEDEYEHEHELKHEREYEHKHECEEQVLSLSDESCAFVECKNDLAQSECKQEEDQDALKVEEIISTLQSEILTKERKAKDKPDRGHRIPQSKSITSKLAEEHDEPVAYDKAYIPQINLIPKSCTQTSESVIPRSQTCISPKALAQNAEFEEWWNTYNHKVDKKIALRAYFKATRRIKASELIKRTQTYLRLREALKKGGKFVPTLKNPATWLNNDCWDAEELRDTSTPQEKEQTALDEIRAKYRGQEAMVREQLFKNLGNHYLVFLSEAQISFKDKTANLLVGGPTAQDELRGSYSYQLKNAFKHTDIEQLIIKNIKHNSPDVSFII